MKVVNIDWWENDAFLQIGERRFYFQFENEASIQTAIKFFRQDAHQESKEALELIYESGYID